MKNTNTEFREIKTILMDMALDIERGKNWSDYHKIAVAIATKKLLALFDEYAKEKKKKILVSMKRG